MNKNKTQIIKNKKKIKFWETKKHEFSIWFKLSLYILNVEKLKLVLIYIYSFFKYIDF
jgi:hypothetical protein